MTDKAKEARKKYQKKWRAQNKDKVRQYNERYWQKRAEEGRDNGKNRDDG